MADSLQEQLLRMGLVDEKKAKQAEKALRQQRKQKQKKKKKGSAPALDRAAQPSAAVARDRALNQAHQEAVRSKALAAQVRQLIEQNRLPLDEGGEAYHFTDGKKVKRLFLSAADRQRVGRGRLAIVRFQQGYALVPEQTAEKIRQRDPSVILVWARNDEQTAQPDQADPYAAYQVPDDLMW